MLSWHADLADEQFREVPKPAGRIDFGRRQSHIVNTGGCLSAAVYHGCLSLQNGCLSAVVHTGSLKSVGTLIDASSKCMCL